VGGATGSTTDAAAGTDAGELVVVERTGGAAAGARALAAGAAKTTRAVGASTDADGACDGAAAVAASAGLALALAFAFALVAPVTGAVGIVVVVVIVACVSAPAVGALPRPKIPHVRPPSTSTTTSSAPANADMRLGGGAARGTVVPSSITSRGDIRRVSLGALRDAEAEAAWTVGSMSARAGSCALGGACGAPW
jgi:hypothetical protein